MTLSRRNSRRERPKMRASLVCSEKTTKVGRVPRRKRCKLRQWGSLPGHSAACRCYSLLQREVYAKF